MADGTIDSEFITLIDNWPGIAIPGQSMHDSPIDAKSHNVTTAWCPIGTKVLRWNHVVAAGGHPGWSTFIYLELAPVTEANPTCAVKQIVVPVDADEIYVVTNDKDQCLLADGCPFAAVMLSTMTPTFDTVPKWGWFWCGGVCPEEYVVAFTGNFLTDGNVAIGPMTTRGLTADSIGFGLATATNAAIEEAIIGFSTTADTDT